MIKRTHTCGQLSIKDLKKTISLNGWISKTRDLGSLIFIDLKDRYGTTQVVFNQDTNNENQTQIFENSNSEEETLTKEREMFEETNSEEDFEIPAFLRRQKN